MGEYFQIQDDFIDCFGDSNITGKIGTDIEDNKCGWLVVQALDMATAEQRKIIEVIFMRLCLILYLYYYYNLYYFFLIEYCNLNVIFYFI